MIFPVAGRGRPRKNHVPDVPSRPAQEMLESAKWQTVNWRRGTKGKLSARFAAMRVRVADGPPQRIGNLGQQHLPGEEVWLVGGECLKLCVSERAHAVFRYIQAPKRSANIMAS